MPRLHLPYLLSFSWAPSFAGTQPGEGWGATPTPRQADREAAPLELIALFIDF